MNNEHEILIDNIDNNVSSIQQNIKNMNKILDNNKSTPNTELINELKSLTDQLNQIKQLFLVHLLEMLIHGKNYYQLTVSM